MSVQIKKMFRVFYYTNRLIFFFRKLDFKHPYKLSMNKGDFNNCYILILLVKYFFKMF